MKLFKLVGEDDSMATTMQQLDDEMGFSREDMDNLNMIQVGQTCNCGEKGSVVQVVRLPDAKPYQVKF